MEDLSTEIEKVCNQFEVDGYCLITIIPIIRGYEDSRMYCSYGYSVTDGVIMTFVKH